MIIAAALCPAPPLLIPALNGAGAVAPDLRQACLTAAGELIDASPDVIAVAGAAEVTGKWPAGARLDLAAFAPGRPGGKERPPAPGAGRPAGPGELPATIGVGSWLLDELGYQGERGHHSVAHAEPPAACARLGAELAASAHRVALLAMADGSARRGPKAPGYLDHRSAAFDAEVERAVRLGDLPALLAIDPGLAGQLMATGRPVWQLLAGSLDGVRVTSQIRYCDDPFGVAYLVASVRV